MADGPKPTPGYLLFVILVTLGLFYMAFNIVYKDFPNDPRKWIDTKHGFWGNENWGEEERPRRRRYRDDW